MSGRFCRPDAVAETQGVITAWNISPNLGYVVTVIPAASAAGVLLYDVAGITLVASGSVPTGVGQPCVLYPTSGQALGMVDVALGWHLRLTTAGSGPVRSIAIAPQADLADISHPVYADADLALLRATAEIDAGTHRTRDISFRAALGLEAELADVITVTVDGQTATGFVRSLRRSGGPKGTSVVPTVRVATPILPVSAAVVAPVVAVDDTGACDADQTATGNVLANDTGDGLIWVGAVAGSAANVGEPVAGSEGGLFTVTAGGDWEFDPGDDFSGLAEGATLATAVAYTVTDGVTEDAGALTVTVTGVEAEPQLWTPDVAAGSIFMLVDPAYSAGVSLDASQRISGYTDPFGIRSITQSVPTNRPWFVDSVVNGLPIVRFSSAQSTSLGASEYISEQQRMSIYVVRTGAVNIAACGESIGGTCLYNNNAQAMLNAGQGFVGESIGQNGVSCHQHNPNVISNILYHAPGGTTFATQFNIVVFVWDVRQPSVWINGILARTGLAANQTAHVYYALGAGAYGKWTGDLAYSAWVAGIVAGVRQQWEGYLAHRFDLTALLPAGHPFKSAPPTI
jgi:VCBS repeat-containing protein